MNLPTISQLAPPSVTALIAFLAYGSQYFFRYTEPQSLEWSQAFIFNALVACIWTCYLRACCTDPGRVPPGWIPGDLKVDGVSPQQNEHNENRQRWCKRCEALKPPRAHHCKTCQRCIPKMDHHCPWTVNCVSSRTFPHFIRFLFYAVTSMAYLEYLMYLRVSIVWTNRHLPSYLGPSFAVMIFLFIFGAVNSLMLFALSMLLVRTVWSLGANVTMIEGWEIERHETLLRRAKALGGCLDGPDGIKVKIAKQEFPYDVGIWQNIKQGMGSSAFFWLCPLALTPPNASGLWFEVNGFEDASVSWPPPDPDRIPRKLRFLEPDQAFTHTECSASGQDQVQAFRRRQEEDLKRFNGREAWMSRRKPFHQRYDDRGHQDSEIEPDADINDGNDGEEGWRDSEGDRLEDFGVDEDIEFYDEDNIPLAELLRRRQEIR